MPEPKNDQEVKELQQKHPLSFELVTGSTHGMIGLMNVGAGAPREVRPYIADALKDMTELNLYVMTTLEEAGDECVTRIEAKVRERSAALKKQADELLDNRQFNHGHALQHMFSLPNRERKIGFDLPADLPQS